jgi:hypothetical protein
MAAARRDGQDGTMLFALVLLLTIGCIAFILVREGQPGPRPDGLREYIRDRRWGLRLFVTEKAVSKHAAGIFAKLDLAPSDDDNRRVLAVLAYLDS